MLHSTNFYAEKESRRFKSTGRRRRWRLETRPNALTSTLLIAIFIIPLISCDIILELDLNDIAHKLNASSDSLLSAGTSSVVRICAAEFEKKHVCKDGSFGDRLVELAANGDDMNRVVQMLSNMPWKNGLSIAVEIRRGDSVLGRKTIHDREASATDQWTSISIDLDTRAVGGSEAPVSLTLRYRLRCADNFYGVSCTRHCEIKPWERVQGRHWSCAADGLRRCEAGWTGAQCTLKRCPGCVNGTCEGRQGKCICRPGYRGDRCDECIPPAKCKGSCNSTQSCVCPEGRGGIYCELDLVYCTKYKPCQNGGLCTNRDGSYHCQCRPGFKGRDCELPINGCEDRPCRNGGVCRHCPVGTYGRHCQARATSCRESPCENGASCAELSGRAPSLRRFTASPPAEPTPPFRCLCPRGWAGVLCDSPFSCTADSCFNGGTCTEDLNTELGFHCHCPLGFRGLRCEEDIDDCQMNPCQNGGVCIDKVAAFRCECLAGYGGPLCEEVVAADQSQQPVQQPSEKRRGRRPADNVAIDQSSLNWLFLSIGIVLFLLVALLLLICYLRRTLITQFEKSLEGNKTVVRFPPPPPLPTPTTASMKSTPSTSSKRPTKGHTKHEKNSSRHPSSSISADSGVYNVEDRYVADPTLGVRQQRPHSQCMRWSRLDDEEGGGDGARCDVVELNYCSMNFMVDMDDTSDIYERIDDEICGGHAPLAVVDDDPVSKENSSA